MAVLAGVAMTAAFVDGNHDSRAAKSEFITSRINLGGIIFYYPGQAPGEEHVYYTITLTNAAVSTHTSDINKFLADPVASLRRQGIAVPQAAERYWKALTSALRRLSNPRIPPSSKDEAPKDIPNLKNEIVRLQIPGGWVSVAGDLNGSGDNFLADPVGTLRTQGVNVSAADEPAWRQLAAALKELRHEYAGSEKSQEPARNRSVRTKSEVNVSGNRAQGSRNQAVTGRISGVAVDPDQGNKNIAQAGQPDLMIKQFLFPPTDDKTVRVQVVNQGNADSIACRLVLTVRKINGNAVGRQTHVNIPAILPGKSVWLVIDAKIILPIDISLKATSFKLNADGTGLVAESDENNNELWHNQ